MYRQINDMDIFGLLLSHIFEYKHKNMSYYQKYTHGYHIMLNNRLFVGLTIIIIYLMLCNDLIILPMLLLLHMMLHYTYHYF